MTVYPPHLIPELDREQLLKLHRKRRTGCIRYGNVLCYRGMIRFSLYDTDWRPIANNLPAEDAVERIIEINVEFWAKQL